MTDLNALADRVEQLEGPCRETDAEIALTEIMPNWRRRGFAPHYTASLDAAMQLVPEGWRFGIEQGALADAQPEKWEAYVWPPENWFEPDWQLGQSSQQDNPDSIRGFAATAPLALCAAALRARAMGDESTSPPNQ